MKSKGKFCLAAAFFLTPAAVFAQGYGLRGDSNLEEICKNSGSGMDPRCVGETAPGTVTDMTTERQQRALQGLPPARMMAVPVEEGGVIIERR